LENFVDARIADIGIVECHFRIYILNFAGGQIVDYRNLVSFIDHPSTKCDPMNPAPPVTKIFAIFVRLLYQ